MRCWMKMVSVGLASLLAGPALAHTALTGGTLIDGSGGDAVDDAIVIIDQDRISCAGTRVDCPIPAGTQVIDIRGQFITPGLIDAHVHFSQTGWLDGRPDGLRDRDTLPYAEAVSALRADPGRWHRSYLCSGVTAVFDVGGPPWTLTGSHRHGDRRSDRVHVRAAGPLVTHADALNTHFSYGPLADQPMFLPLESPEQIRADVARLQAWGSDAVKVWFLAPPAPEAAPRLNALAMEAGAAAREAGLPLIVHATELAQAKTALRAGANMLVHSVVDRPVDQEFLDLLLANDATYAPTLVVGRNWSLAMLSAATGEPAAIRDDSACVDEDMMALLGNPGIATEAVLARSQGRITPFAMRMEGEGVEMTIMAANLRAVRDAGGRIVLATDAGNPLTLHGPSAFDELDAMQAAGMTPAEVIHAATAQGAVAMDMAESIGTVQAGKIADLLVLGEDPRESVSAFRSLTHIMRAGILRSQEELQVR